jgi:hypothetical protein
MRPFTLAAGVAALTGGALRIIAIFTTGTFAPQTLAWFYFLIDVCSCSVSWAGTCRARTGLGASA